MCNALQSHAKLVVLSPKLCNFLLGQGIRFLGLCQLEAQKPFGKKHYPSGLPVCPKPQRGRSRPLPWFPAIGRTSFLGSGKANLSHTAFFPVTIKTKILWGCSEILRYIAQKNSNSEGPYPVRPSPCWYVAWFAPWCCWWCTHCPQPRWPHTKCFTNHSWKNRRCPCQWPHCISLKICISLIPLPNLYFALSLC